jgi:AcrR family transcriptional regulator
MFSDGLRVAMIELCCERGFRDLSVEDLCRRAEVDPAEFHRNYSGLEDCFAQIYEVQRDEFAAAVARGFFSQERWRDQMRAAAYAMLEFLREDRDRAYFMSVQVHYGGDRARLIRDEAMQGFFLLIDQGRRELPDPDSLTFHTAEAIGSAIYQQFQTAIADNDFDGLEEMIPHMLYVATLPYLGPEVAAEELEIAPPALQASGRGLP